MPESMCKRKANNIIVRTTAHSEYRKNLASSWQETLHLLRSPANAARLKAAVDELDKTGGAERKLVE